MFFFFKQKTAYEMRISDWSSDVCSSDLFSGSSNPLVAAANSLLVLIPQIRATPAHPSPQLLREHLLDEVRQFEMRAQQAGIPNETILGEIGRASCREGVCQYV